jgi:hypothetical protein
VPLAQPAVPPKRNASESLFLLLVFYYFFLLFLGCVTELKETAQVEGLKTAPIKGFRLGRAGSKEANFRLQKRHLCKFCGQEKDVCENLPLGKKTFLRADFSKNRVFFPARLHGMRSDSEPGTKNDIYARAPRKRRLCKPEPPEISLFLRGSRLTSVQEAALGSSTGAKKDVCARNSSENASYLQKCLFPESQRIPLQVPLYKGLASILVVEDIKCSHEEKRRLCHS